MGTLAINADERVTTVEFTSESLVVGLMDGRLISTEIRNTSAWFCTYRKNIEY